MERDQTLSFTPVDHPDVRVQRTGFDLTHPYLEQCWSAVAGPSSTLLLRRLPALWVTQAPAEIGASELSQSLGLGAGVGQRSRLANTLERIVRFGLAHQAADGAGLDVYRQVAPLRGRQLDRLPAWNRDAHERLFGAHLDRLDSSARHETTAASITARLDRLQHGPGRGTNGASTRGRGLGR